MGCKITQGKYKSTYFTKISDENGVKLKGKFKKKVNKDIDKLKKLSKLDNLIKNA